jgi:hypothetical protein
MEYYLGVFHTTSDRCRSHIVKFSGILLDTRKRDMLPSCLCGQNKTPSYKLGGMNMAADFQRKK